MNKRLEAQAWAGLGSENKVRIALSDSAGLPKVVTKVVAPWGD